MRDLFVDFLTITQSFEYTAKGDRQLWGQTLFFPEVNTFANDAAAISGVQESIVQSLLEHADADELQRRMLPEGEIEKDSIAIHLAAPDRTNTWRRPLELQFEFLFWRHQSGAKVGYVPSLGIEVVAADEKKFDEMLEDHIRFALNRAGVQHSLFDLALLQRCSEITVAKVEWNAYPLTPNERYERDENSGAGNKPVLGEVGNQINLKKMPLAFERAEAVKQLAWMLAGRRATSVLLVGESGVGKTAIVHHLSEMASTLKMGAIPIFQTSGSRIVAGMTGFGEWQERCRKIVEEAKEQKALIFFGNLFELMQVGQSAASSESLGSFFRPYLIRGEFLAVAECTPQQLALIEQIDPRILDAFRQLKIEPSNDEETKTILQKKNDGVTFEAGMLERLVTLHKRYSGDSAFPGKAVRFLDRIIEKHGRKGEKSESLQIGPAEVDEAFAAETGMPKFLIDERQEINLEEIEKWFSERLKGQGAAVNLVIDTIAAIKARLSRPGKPLGSFLFIGPTGVGKTELAKTLAEFFYGSKDRLIRLDMSEYALPGSAGRLAAGNRSDDEGILTAQMRDQPFSVLLLDEFEKADASVYDLFLQVLGEARLTDAAGRLADFSNAIVILTSNLGAREFRLTRPGFHDSAMEVADVANEHFTESVKKNFRPEFFNRIDRIVPFSPLDRDAVRSVVKREIEMAEHRDGLKNRNVSLIVPDSCIDRLADIGYDPRYGARPVKRAIEQWLLVPVGEFFCDQEENEEICENGFLEITGISEEDVPQFEFRKATEDTKGEKREKEDWFGKVPRIRRDFQRLAASSLVNELQSERNRIRQRLSGKNARHEGGGHQRLADLDAILDGIQAKQTRVMGAEEQLLLARFREESSSEFEAATEGMPDDDDFASALLNALGEVRQVPKRLVLVIKGDNWEWLSQLAEGYEVVAGELGNTVRRGYWEKHPKKEHIHPDDRPDPKKPPVEVIRSIPVIPETPADLENLLSVPPDDFAALAIEISGEHAAMRFSREVGLHGFVDEAGNKSHAAIGFFDEGETLEEAWLPDGMMLDQDFTQLISRRSWDQQARRMRDSKLGASPGTPELRLPWEFSTKHLGELINAALVLEAKAFL